MREENRNEKIHEALNFLDDTFIEDVEKLRGQILVERADYEDENGRDKVKSFMEHAENDKGRERQNLQGKRNYTWKKWTALAASICLVISCGWFTWNSFLRENDDTRMESVGEDSATGGIIANGREDIVDTNEHSDGIDYVEVEGDTEVSFHNLLTLEQMLASAVDMEGKEITDIPISENEIYPLESSQGLDDYVGAMLPPMLVDLKEMDTRGDEIAYDMLAFFIHEGRCYVQNEWIENGAAIVGKYAGRANGLINEWTKDDGYVDGAGSIAGKFYEVKGIAPEFMLCMILDNGVVETYINNNGITLKSGADVVEKRLHLMNNYKDVSFYTHKAWNERYEEKKQPVIIANEGEDVWNRFLEAYAKAEFMYLKDTTLAREKCYNSDEIYHLYFTTAEGVKVQFWLLGDGYVVFHGLNNVCVQIEPQVYDEVTKLLRAAR